MQENENMYYPQQAIEELQGNGNYQFYAKLILISIYVLGNFQCSTFGFTIDVPKLECYETVNGQTLFFECD